MEKRCSICKNITESETSPILVMGSFGNPKYLCPDCADDMEAVTESRDYEVIRSAMNRIGEALSRSNSNDEEVLDTVNTIFTEASDRAEKIKAGVYDFEAEEALLDEAAEGEDSIPEELLESEEDRLLDEKEAKTNKKLDTVLTWVMTAVFIAVFVYLGIKIFG